MTPASKSKSPPKPPEPTTFDGVRAEARLCEVSLRQFTRKAWHVVEPATEYGTNWHIDVLCDHLEAVLRGEIRKLLVTVPPRHMKSLGVTVFWPAWAWGPANRPELRWLFASYAASLSIKHSVVCRRLIESAWYQRRWGRRFALAYDQNMKSRFENDRTGIRLATSVGGAITGEGGDVVVVDDPHNVQEAFSEAKREDVISWWDQVMSTRLNDPQTGARVIIQQRVHEADLAGHVIEQGDWTHLCLPAEFEPKHPFVWPDDPRTERGEVLWPDRWGEAWLEEKKRDLGSYGYAGQYQQRPAPAEGGILKRAWWRYYAEVPQLDEVIESWDMAFKEGDETDYVVGQLWGRDLANRYLLGQVRARLDFPATKAAVRALTEWATERWRVGAILVEDKANGPAIISELRREIEGLIPVEPQGGKEARAHAAAPSIESGNVYLPESKMIPAPPGYEETPTEAFLHETTIFPKGANDDQVDSATQAIIRLGRSGGKGRVRMGGYDSDSHDI